MQLQGKDLRGERLVQLQDGVIVAQLVASERGLGVHDLKVDGARGELREIGPGLSDLTAVKLADGGLDRDLY